MAAISGWGGRVSVTTDAQTVVMPVGRWSVTARMDAPEVTTMEHFGHGSYAAGVNDHDVTFDCFWDTAVNPFAAIGPNLFPGTAAKSALNPATNYVAISLFLDKNSNARVWAFSTVLVTNVSTDDEVRGVVRYTVSGMASNRVNFLTDTVTQSSTFQAPSN